MKFIKYFENSINKELISAVVGGYIWKVKNLIQRGADINFIDTWTPLIYAANQGNYPMVKFLIDEGADINLSDKLGETPLMMASSFDNIDIVRELLNAHVDITPKHNRTQKEPEYNDWNALTYAVANDNYSIAELLIEAGCDVNNINNHGISTLMVAIDREKLNMVKLLIQNNADINHQNNAGETPLIFASIVDLDVVSSTKNFVKNVVDELIKAGANWNIKDNDGNDFLDYYFDKQDIIKKYPKKYKEYLILKDGEIYNI